VVSSIPLVMALHSQAHGLRIFARSDAENIQGESPRQATCPACDWTPESQAQASSNWIFLIDGRLDANPGAMELAARTALKREGPSTWQWPAAKLTSSLPKTSSSQET